MSYVQHTQIVTERFDKHHGQLIDISNDTGKAPTKCQTGDIYENLVMNVTECLELDNRKQRLDVSSGGYSTGIEADNIIFDKHGKPVCVVECKTYLDACFLKRFVMDAVLMCESFPDLEFRIVSGQNALSDGAYEYYLRQFESLTGKTFKTYYVLDMGYDNPDKKRASGQTELYKNLGYDLDQNVLVEFIQDLKETCRIG